MDRKENEILLEVAKRRLERLCWKDQIRVREILEEMGVAEGFSLLDMLNAEAELMVEKDKEEDRKRLDK